jgi:hypothetical protein
MKTNVREQVVHLLPMQELGWVLLAVVVAMGMAGLLVVEHMELPLWLVMVLPPLAFVQFLVVLLHVFLGG